MIADWVRRFPDRFVGCFSIPLKDPHLAHSGNGAGGEAAWAAGRQSPGQRRGRLSRRAALSSVLGGRERPRRDRLHPSGRRARSWFQKYSLWNSVGQPIEEAKVMSSLIYEGVLESFPDMTIVMAHGGGYMPHYHGRLDRNVKNRPDTMANIKHRAELVPEALLLRHLPLRSDDAGCADRKRSAPTGFFSARTSRSAKPTRSGFLRQLCKIDRRSRLRADFRRDRLRDSGASQRTVIAVFRLDAGGLDDGAVALDAVLEQIGKLLRRSADRRVAVGVEILHDVGLVERLGHLGIEPADDGLRQARRAEKSEPRRRLAKRRDDLASSTARSAVSNIGPAPAPRGF